MSIRGSGRSPILTASYTSAEQTIVSSGALTLAHGLGVTPKIVQVWAVCKTAESGFSVGQKVLLCNESASGHGMAITYDASNIYIRQGSTATYAAADNTDGSGIYLTQSNWRLEIRAYA